jgi:ferric-dicitrate binding protein FerR (iron transport regulator)
LVTDDHIINEEEWENFQPDQVLSPDVSGKLWNNVRKNTAPAKTRYVYGIAASVVLMAGLSMPFLWNRRLAGARMADMKNMINHTPRKMALALSDGSTVELLPNSSLSYVENFNARKRDVVLNGEATFDVAKDAARPFSVYSDSMLITVLGTRFTVASYAANKETKVILHEGAVMVSLPGKNDYRLAAGDVFIDNPTTARVLHLQKDKDGDFVFDDYPLEVVFDQLQMVYNTKIVYNGADLGNRTFIGKIDEKDSLDHILKSIAMLNNFQIHKQGDSFVITH